MYRYDAQDFSIVRSRAKQFTQQVERRIAGDITEDEFKPLRLQNGLYMQLHSYMLRVAIPYGCLSANQMRGLASISQKYDRGYGHFTTRQNIQFNWPDLRDVPKILSELAELEMHAIQSSGNCIRNITSDPFAGVAADEWVDPRPYCELLRQWSTFHPEFAFLPRKFKIAVTGAKTDRAAVAFHDIGIKIKIEDEQPVFEIWVGGGQGRSPFIAQRVHPNLPQTQLLSYLEAILRTYNRYGRRDNKYKARIKFLVSSLGLEAFKKEVEEEWAAIDDPSLLLNPADLWAIQKRFVPAQYQALEDASPALKSQCLLDPEFGHWHAVNVVEHRVQGYSAVTVSLKHTGLPPGDATHTQMNGLADLADEFGQGRLVVTHRQNIVMPDVQSTDLYALWKGLRSLSLGRANVDRVTDTICCPGLDYCNLANARSINVSQEIEETFAEFDRNEELGPIHLNISGCINACGHHHVGHIGILGINKLGEEYYQVSLGGSSSDDASLAKIIGRAFTRQDLIPALQKILTLYANERLDTSERFIDTYRRIGVEPFKETLYGNHQKQGDQSRPVDTPKRNGRRSA